MKIFLAHFYASNFVNRLFLQRSHTIVINKNQDKAMKPQTVQIVRQGEATPYWFLLIHYIESSRREIKINILIY
ncbi:hypothetical protein BWZ28_09070 [Neisseria meningitidis]|nr:hypothetical protein BWZ28_09070 [Neisseria meningitidis]